jgi:hypothetical protein
MLSGTGADSRPLLLSGRLSLGEEAVAQSLDGPGEVLVSFGVRDLVVRTVLAWAAEGVFSPAPVD